MSKVLTPETLAAVPRVASPQANASATPNLSSAVEQALERLLLANQIRELASYPRPVTTAQAVRLPAVVIRLVRTIYRASQRVETKPSTWRLLRWVLLDATVLLGLRLLLSRGRVWRLGRETIGTLIRNVVLHKTRYHARPASTITGYVRTGDQESPLIRVCVLLQIMKRYGACVDFLLQRLRSGLPSEQTRQWLALSLREIGDRVSADQLATSQERVDECDTFAERHSPGSKTVSRSTRFSYGVVISAMFDSEVFRRSLMSLLESDFRGQIVVAEDGHQPQRECEAFCKPLGVGYVKSPQWSCSGAINLGIEQLDHGTTIVLYAQNDILWPPQWLEHLNHAWETVYDSGKVALINLGYVQLNPGVDAACRDLFLRGRYEELLWGFRMMKEIQPLRDSFRDCQNHDVSRLFGLGRDAWMDRPAEFSLMMGRFSVGGSFLLDAWRALGGFSPDLPLGLDIELQYQSCMNRRWNLWLNNRPLIHMASSDTSRLTNPADHARSQQLGRDTSEGFAKKYGWEVDHFFWTWYAETCVIYHDQIVEAVNEGRFAEVEVVFDDFVERLKRKTLSSCELTSCHSRATCRYV